jgi:hypothetical protein
MDNIVEKIELKNKHFNNSLGLIKDYESTSKYLDVPVKERAKLELNDPRYIVRLRLHWDDVIIFHHLSVFNEQGLIWWSVEKKTNYVYVFKQEEVWVYESFDKWLDADTLDVLEIDEVEKFFNDEFGVTINQIKEGVKYGE